MQQNPSCPDIGSPYMLWQYVQLMAPFTNTDSNIHPAFTHVSPHAIQSMGQIQDHCSNNYHVYNPHYPHQHHSTNDVLYNGYRVSKDSLYLPENDILIRTKRSKTHAANDIHKVKLAGQHATEPLITSSSPKKPSFTIDAILRKEEEKKPEIASLPVLSPLIDRVKNLPESITNPITPTAITPRKTDHCSPLNSQLSILPPLMHSTPISYNSQTAPRRHGRFLEPIHPSPYLIQQQPQYAANDQHNHHLAMTFQQHPCMVPSSQMTSSLSSASSSGSFSTPSSTSTSPESTSVSRCEKPERRSAGKSKRIRTIFTPEQLDRLEAEFERQQYMVGTERFFLASSLSLTEAQVKVWFQNRRIKWRKQHLEQQQARLAQGDLFRDLEEESGDSDMEETRTVPPETRENNPPRDCPV